MTDLYRHFNKQGRLLYVGVSLSAFNRFLQHGNRRGEIVRMEIENFPDQRTALRAEKKAIADEKPLYNIQHTRTTPRAVSGNSMLSVRVPNYVLNALDRACKSSSFASRSDAVVTLLSEGLRSRGILDGEA